MILQYRDNVMTAGKGLWSNVSKEVVTVGFSIPYLDEDFDFGELRIYFDTDSWNVEDDGLIYTDPLFLANIREAFGTDDINYSEQGMQGDNFVSFDIGKEFILMYGDQFYESTI